jgi:hypothetical protein
MSLLAKVSSWGVSTTSEGVGIASLNLSLTSRSMFSFGFILIKSGNDLSRS